MPPRIQKDLKHLLASVPEEVGLAFHDGEAGEEILIRADIPFHPASTIKICVMMEAFHQAANGEFSLDDTLLVKNKFHSIADGSLFSLSMEDDGETDLYNHIHKRLPLRDLINRMITRSSNLATNLILEKIGARRVTRFMYELGVPDLLVLRGPEDNRAYALGMNSSASARGLMQILVALASGRVISQSASQEMVAILKQQRFNEGIPAKLPLGVDVAHKTGLTEKLYHDAAIVYPPNRGPYVLVVMTHGLPELDEAPALVAEISSLIYHSRFS
jgi:beta-lactamase class A